MRFPLKHVLLATVLSLALPTIANTDAEEEEVLAALDARLRAMIAEDVDALSELLTDELHYSHTRGSVETKPQFLTTIESKRIDYLAATPRDLKVRLIGDTAVLTGLSDMSVIYRGEPLEFTIRFLEISHKLDGHWQLIAWQSVRYDPT